MAEQADAFVKNTFDSDIVVTRILPDESSEDNTIGSGKEKRFPLLVSEESLIINAPEGKDTENLHITVRSSIIDLKVRHSTTNWTLRIIPNDLPPEVPTTVNVSVGDPGGG
jgi:hypothetical protein